MISVILLMAGSGRRMNIEDNKVFLPLGEKRVFEHALQMFLNFGFEVICVIRPEDRQFLSDYYAQVKIVYGGKTRQESVYHGLKEATQDFVLIHDAARPFVSKEMIESCIHVFHENQACMVGTSCKDSLYLKSPLQVVHREEIVLAQTPQGGCTKVLLNCHQMAMKEDKTFTDDISLLLKYSDTNVKIIEKEEANFKITTKLDYIVAKEWVKNV